MIESLFTYDLDVMNAPMVTDRYEQQAPDWDHPVVERFPGWLSQRSAAEALDNRTAEIGDWVAFLPIEAPITGESRVRWADPTFGVTRVFEVVGPPTPAHTPGGPHHIEAIMREVRG